MNILGLNKTTLLDYPGRVSATIFIGGCNFCCPFCHNALIVHEDAVLKRYSVSEITDFLYKRKNVLAGVCITGGEPTLNRELPEFLHDIKNMGYLIKLDTNGTNPDMLKLLIMDGLIDYCAMDIKNCPKKYNETCGIMGGIDIGKINTSVMALIGQDKIDYEFRTTVVKELHNTEDILGAARWIKGAKQYFLQGFLESDGVIRRGSFSPYTKDEMNAFVDICREFVDNTYLRGY